MSKQFGNRAARHVLALVLTAVMAGGVASATERLFTYTYEPEVFPKGAWEFEQWVTWRAGRNEAVGQNHYSRFEVREELEYGVTDNYTASLYYNGSYTSFREPDTGNDKSRFLWDGVSIENRYMLLNPATNPVGLTLYVEPRFSDREVEFEQKIILGQRCGDWKWALNLIHATEWSLLKDGGTEGEVELVFGLARQLGHHWSIGFELRDHNELPEYERWENSAVYLGPAISYRAEHWWVALTVLPQIYGTNFQQNPDREVDMELEGHEKINVRLIVGFSF